MEGNLNTKTYAVLLSGIFISLIFFSFSPLTAEMNANTIIVDKDGTEDYTTITAAIQAADNQDMILVSSGVYEETEIIINKTITLTGQNSSSTIIRGDGTSTVLIIQANEVTISDFTIEHGGDWQKENIVIYSDECLISNNIFRNGNGSGLSLYNSKQTTVEDNSFYSNQEGITCYNSSDIIISNNQITESIAGIYLYHSTNNIIQLNMVTACSKGIYLEESNENAVQRNQLISNQQGMFVSYAANNQITENNFITNVEQAKFTMWLSPTGLQMSFWNANYWDDSLGIFPKWIPGIIFIRTYNPIGIFIPWGTVDWHPASEPYQ